jgi:hypothetical protein
MLSEPPPVERKGISRIIEAEKEGDRYPRLMPHNHPGFDIELKNDKGAFERLIEVKSTVAAWRERGVALSREFNLCRGRWHQVLAIPS